MDHSDIRHKLSGYMDDEVTPEERAAIDAHLRTCPTCADALAELRKTVEHIREVDEVAPPAWMTSKIMAKVREEAGPRNVFQRLLDLFVVNRAIRVVAVLFLTITAYYIYSASHPAQKYSEAPMEGLAKKEAPSFSQEPAKQKAASPERRDKKVEQAPGYRSLDMKDEYEKPSPPAALDRAAPSAPAPSAKLARKPPTAEEAVPASRGEMPSKAYAPMLAEQATGAAAQAEAGRGTAAKERKAADASRAGDARLGVNALQSPGADEVAEEMTAVTSYFTDHDLTETMKVKGLRFFTQKVPDDLAGMEWLREMKTYRAVPCAKRYIVDVELPGSSEKYLYCYDKARVRRLGVFTPVSGVWMERK